jgi:predicted HicB family RNase H-like nuclease
MMQKKKGATVPTRRYAAVQIYVSEQDRSLWEAAKDAAKDQGVSLSAFVSSALRKVIP